MQPWPPDVISSEKPVPLRGLDLREPLNLPTPRAARGLAEPALASET
jgi:hypothetical protein